jgi:hypothetical protein
VRVKKAQLHGSSSRASKGKINHHPKRDDEPVAPASKGARVASQYPTGLASRNWRHAELTSNLLSGIPLARFRRDSTSLPSTVTFPPSWDVSECRVLAPAHCSAVSTRLQPLDASPCRPQTRLTIGPPLTLFPFSDVARLLPTLSAGVPSDDSRPNAHPRPTLTLTEAGPAIS